jgi:hypothetical protein
MPFQSESQRRYLWMNHPDIARRWSHDFPGQHDLPKHKEGAMTGGTKKHPAIRALHRFQYELDNATRGHMKTASGNSSPLTDEVGKKTQHGGAEDESKKALSTDGAPMKTGKAASGLKDTHQQGSDGLPHTDHGRDENVPKDANAKALQDEDEQEGKAGAETVGTHDLDEPNPVEEMLHKFRPRSRAQSLLEPMAPRKKTKGLPK